MNRALRVTAWISVAALMAVLGLTILVLTTETGLDWAWRLARPLLPQGLSIQALKGRVIGPLQLRGVQLRSQTLDLSVDELDLQWRPEALLDATLDLERIVIKGLSVTRLAEGEGPIVLPQRVALPLALRLVELRLEGFEFRATPQAQALVIRRAEAALSFADAVFSVAHLALEGPQYQVRGKGRIDTEGRYPIDASLQWQAEVPGYARLVGATAIGGDLGRLSVRQTVAAPYALQGEAQIEDPLREPRYELVLEAEGLALGEVYGGWPAITLRGRLQGSGDPERLVVTGALSGEVPELGPLEASLRGAWQSDRVVVEALRLARGAGPGRVTATGEIGLQGTYPLNLHASWEQLQWPLQGEAQVTSPQGTLQLQGRWSAYRLSGDAMLLGTPPLQARVRLAGEGTPQALQLSEISVDALKGQLQGSGEIVWQPGLRVHLDLEGQGIDPQALAPEWPGRLGLRLVGAVSRVGARWNGDLARLEAEGELRGQPLRLKGLGRLDSKGASMAELDLQSGPSHLSLSGTLEGARAELDWRLRSPDLASLWPGLAGEVQAEGRIQGRRDAPRLSAKVSGTRLRYAQYGIGQLALRADVDGSDRQDSALSVDLKQAVVGGLQVATLHLKGQGRRADHTLTLGADTAQGAAELAIHGVLTDTHWRFRLDRARLAYQGLAPWTLASPAGGRVARDGNELELSRSCWRSQQARLCVQGRRAAGRGEGQFELSRFPFAYLVPWLPEGTEWTGTLDARGSLGQDPAGTPQAQVELKTSGGRLLPGVLRDQPDTALVFLPGEGRLRLDAQGLDLRLDMPLADQGGVVLALASPPSVRPLTDRTLQGRLEVDMRRLDFIPALVPQVDRVQGRIEGRLQIAGTLGQPDVSGRLSWVDAAAQLDALGISLQDMHLALTGEGRHRMGISGRVRSGEGTLQLDGMLDMGRRPWVLRASLRGADFQVMDTYEAQALVSPDISAVLEGRRVDVEGELQVPRATVHLKELPVSAVSVSRDEIIVSAASEPGKEERYQIHTRLRLVLGPDVHFEGLGLKAQLQGNLLLTDRPGQVTTASGEIQLQDGRYKAYGQDLEIERGNLFFAGGPVADPGLDIRAVRRPVSGVVVGVEAKGTLRAPELSLFSDPAMSQQEQLSYLVLGRSLKADSSDAERNSVNQAALGLALGGGGLFAEGLGERLGLDEASVETDTNGETEQASLVIGKYLSPKLYISYGLGLFEPVSTVRLRYSITDRWKIVTESKAAGSGADIFYTIER